ATRITPVLVTERTPRRLVLRRMPCRISRAVRTDHEVRVVDLRRALALDRRTPHVVRPAIADELHSDGARTALAREHNERAGGHTRECSNQCAHTRPPYRVAIPV